MTTRVMEKEFFHAPDRKRINPVLSAILALVLAGCSYSDESAQFFMAPPPPDLDPAAVSQFGPPHIMAFSGQSIAFPSTITLSDTGMPGQDAEYYAQRAALTSSTSEAKKCSIKDRIDRDALVAYQWRQNRLGLRIKGVNMDSQGIEEIKFEYKLRLQPHKTRKEKCRYESGWQGLIGSGYNEMFLREKDTIWNQLDDITNKAEDAVDKIF